MKTSFIYNILNSQPILIKFALKLFVCKCLSFQTPLLFDVRFHVSNCTLSCDLCCSYKPLYQSPIILTALFQHNLINVSYLTARYLYQVMMTLHFLYDVANDAESTQKTKITS